MEQRDINRLLSVCLSVCVPPLVKHSHKVAGKSQVATLELCK